MVCETSTRSYTARYYTIISYEYKSQMVNARLRGKKSNLRDISAVRDPLRFGIDRTGNPILLHKLLILPCDVISVAELPGARVTAGPGRRRFGETLAREDGGMRLSDCLLGINLDFKRYVIVRIT